MPAPGGVWAELGAGTGTFTRALAELLGPGAVLHAIDRSPAAVAALGRLEPAGATVIPRRADFTVHLELDQLDGVLMANALHFVRDQAAVLTRVAAYLRPGGRLLLVEYDQARGNPWVPFPVPPDAFRSLAAGEGFSPPDEIGRRRSSFGRREMYAAVALSIRDDP